MFFVRNIKASLIRNRILFFKLALSKAKIGKVEERKGIYFLRLRMLCKVQNKVHK